MNFLNVNWYQIFYWLSVADNVKTVTLTLWIVLGVYVLGASLAALGMFENAFNTWEKGSRRVFYIFSIGFLLSIFTWMFLPSKKDCMLIIAGGSVGTFLSTDSSSKALPADLTKYLHLKLNSELNELGDETKKELGLQTKKEEFVDKLKDFSKEQIIDYLKKDTTILK